jgi:hypothetical protein
LFTTGKLTDSFFCEARTSAIMHNSSSQFPREDSCVEMLCYLVVLQLVTVAHARTSLTAPQLEKSVLLWCARNGTRYDAHECRGLAYLSMKLAPELSVFAPLLDAVRCGKVLSEWHVNDESQTVSSIRNICASTLRNRSNSLL